MGGNTEKRNPVSAGIDEKPVDEVLRIINAEDQRVPTAVAGQLPPIADAVEAVADCILRGGRVFFLGAGTSGRLGVVEAAEMPPTFGVPPRLFQAVMAGGQEAVFRSVEEAEDDESAGAEALARHRLSKKDVLVALSASGRTPFVIGALRTARSVGAGTVLITCNPDAPAKGLSDIPIVVDVGPEVVAGSTRLKAGTAQKLVLNMLTTAAMIRLGNVFDGYMVGVRPKSRKLRERAAGIVSAIAGVGRERAADALDRARGDVKVAVIVARTGASPGESMRILEQASGSLRRALKEMGVSE
jgi:N-acetylmuramic acid 6-phosphate etherase